MATIDREDALARAAEISNETAKGANTAERIGSLFRDIADSFALLTELVTFKCHVRRNTNHSTITGSTYQLPWDQEVVDVGNMFTPGGATITIPVSGPYKGGISIKHNTNGGTMTVTVIQTNEGVDSNLCQSDSLARNVLYTATFAGVFNAGDTVRVEINSPGVSIHSTAHFWIEKL